MNIEDIKVGETYNVRMKVTYKEKDQVCVKNPMVSVYGCDYMVVSHKYIHPTTEQPKYDPCRKFREGDIVEPCQVKGRWFGTAWKNRSGIRFTVTKDEDEEGVMWVQDPDSLHPKDVEAVFFQLVTPVEELEPYIVYENLSVCGVMHRDEKDGKFIAVYFISHYGKTIARERAEAECARLNEEYRKEQSCKVDA